MAGTLSSLLLEVSLSLSFTSPPKLSFGGRLPSRLSKSRSISFLQDQAFIFCLSKIL